MKQRTRVWIKAEWWALVNMGTNSGHLELPEDRHFHKDSPAMSHLFN